MKVVVLGSGIIGVSTAWWLRQAGHEVVVVDRRSGPAQETSRANGGQISVSYAEPWANPQAPWQIVKWMLDSQAPLLFKPRLSLHQWQWCWHFLRQCMPSRLEPNIRALVTMAEYSRHNLQQLRDQLGLRYHQQQRGIITFYRDEAEFEASQRMSDLMRDLGIDRRIMSTDELLQLEPALAHGAHAIAGGDYTLEDESGDAHLFTLELAKQAVAQGVQFLFQHQVSRLVAEQGDIKSVELIDPDGAYVHQRADAYVVAMGSFSPSVLKPLGVPCMVYPAKGYSLSFTILDIEAAPSVSLTDKQHKVVYSRLGNRLRMAGTAELASYSRALNDKRIEFMRQQAAELFPNALDFDNVQYWAGLRPATPSNVPLIGQARIRNLYLNTGHGTLGWTMGVGSGRALADIISGRKPEPEFPFLS